MRILDIIHQTTADGPGFRVSVYAAGCNHRCPGCHNPQSWDMKGGREMTVEEVFAEIEKDDFSTGVTFTGGDPFYQVEEFTELAKLIMERTTKNIWCYTGFTYEEIVENEKLSVLLPYLDALVDGPYIESQRDVSLRFRGSKNQRIMIFLRENPLF